MSIKSLHRSDDQQSAVGHPLTETDIVSLENKLKGESTVSSDFKDFLLRYNGGRFNECVFLEGPRGPVIVSDFLPLSAVTHSILTSLSYFDQELNKDLLPFASDPGGNYFLLGLKNEMRDKVFFWDHERRCIHEISISFEIFINSLLVDS